MLIFVLNIKLTCEWYKAIKLNYKNTRTHVIVVFRDTKHFTQVAADALSRQGHCITMLASGIWLPGMRSEQYGVTDGVQYVDTPEAHTFRWPLSP